ncbi:MAG: hypothetical protein JWM28_3776 [Chitinophagaceae bacterium]|nr:hypothetical protein [Chitinophagaceae bacterium]
MKEELEKIDNYILTSAIAILAAFVLVYSTNNGVNLLFSITTILSIIFLVCCILLILYKKYRDSLRKSIFENDKGELLKEFKINLDKYDNDFLIPQILKTIKLVLSNKENEKIVQEDPKKLKDLLEQEHVKSKKEFDFTQNIFVENLSIKLEKILDKSFSGPLKEKNAIIKYQIESFAKYRYKFFVLGLIAFIISVGSKLF